MKTILLLPKLVIHNANALSSPYTIGFPAMTAWLGAVHALQRKINQTECSDVNFVSAGVICHKIHLHTYQGKGDFIHSIIGTGNPLDKNGNRSPIIEEPRCDITASLIIECQHLSTDNPRWLSHLANTMNSGLKIAGGDLLAFGKPEILTITHEKSLRSLTRRLMPGYTLIERRELMEDAMREGQDAMDALLDYLKICFRSQQPANDKVTWTAKRKTAGWIVPIATGFYGITPLGSAQNQRDPNIPHRFAESLVTLGEFIMPYRVKHLDEILWHHHYDPQNNYYLIQQNTRNH